jgi:hypothetical protein
MSLPIIEGRHTRDHVAYQLAIRTWVARLVERELLNSDTPAKETIICEFVERAKSNTPQDEILFFQNQLLASAADYNMRMTRFRWVEDKDAPFTEKEPTNAPAAKAPQQKRKRKSSPPGSGTP